MRSIGVKPSNNDEGDACSLVISSSAAAAAETETAAAALTRISSFYLHKIKYLEKLTKSEFNISSLIPGTSIWKNWSIASFAALLNILENMSSSVNKKQNKINKDLTYNRQNMVFQK